MIAEGAVAPDFSGTTADGRSFRLSSLVGSPVVLYFYPKANTPGCTREAREFTDEFPALDQEGVRVVGVSVDSIETQRSFAEKCGVPFPLVADRSGEIAERYGVRGAFGLARRVTFLLGPDLTVDEVVESFLPGPHLRATRAWVERRASGRAGRA